MIELILGFAVYRSAARPVDGGEADLERVHRMAESLKRVADSHNLDLPIDRRVGMDGIQHLFLAKTDRLKPL